MAKSPEEQAATMIANLKANTGKTLEQWVAIAKKSGEEKHGGVVKHLKAEHGLTHGFANLVAHKYLKSDAGSAEGGDDALVAAQYAGAKADLKPVYDALIKAATAFGKDVEIAPKKTYVSLRRNKQFALVQPSTKTRVDLGVNLKDEPAKGRLEKSGSFNAMVSHRVKLEKPTDVDKDVKAWLKKAYSQA
ncbi:MAG: phosphoribosylformylglycinamidine synthase [Parvularcula sp.]|nr:phosphoribosylformylglycinamidine synthase [Parvularcula sp.]